MSVRVWALPAVTCVLCDALIVLTVLDLRGERVLQFVVGAQVMALLAGIAVLLLARVGPRQTLAAGWAAAALGAASVAAAPIPVEWQADCNTHVGITYAAAAPYVWLARPPETRVVFGGVSTLMACYDEPRERGNNARSS